MKVQEGAHANASHRRGAGLRIRSMRDELLLAKAPATRERKTIKDAIVERQVAWLFIVLGNACFQYGRIYGPGSNNRYEPTIGTKLNNAVGSEDCLYLNIRRPADRRGDRPVIVFEHCGINV